MLCQFEAARTTNVFPVHLQTQRHGAILGNDRRRLRRFALIATAGAKASVGGVEYTGHLGYKHDDLQRACEYISE